MTKILEEIEGVQEDLRDLENYVESFYNFLPLAVVIVNPLGIIINVNKAFEDLTGFTSIKIIGQPLIDVFLEKRKIKKIEEEAQIKKETETTELTLLSKGKEKIPVKVSICPRKDKEGNFIGYFIGISNIKELKQHQEELEEKVNERTAQLRERIEELEKFRRLTVGREIKMIELKEEIKKLEQKLRNLKGGSEKITVFP